LPLKYIAAASWLAIVGYFAWENNMQGELWRAGLFFASVGIAPLGLILAEDRTRSQKTQIVSTEFVHSAAMLGEKDVVVRSSGIEALRELAIGNGDRAGVILRILASHVRSTSSRIFHEIIEGGKTYPLLCLPMEKCQSGINATVRDGKSMPSDIEASLASIKEIINQKNSVFPSMIADCEGDRGRFTIDLSNSIFINSALSNTKLTKANLSQIHAAQFTFEYTSFKSANLSGAYFKACPVRGCSFDEAEFRETTMVDMKFKKASFRGALFEKGCVFENCAFSHADFRDAEIHMSCFDRLDPASFEGADFSNAKIYASDEGLAREKLSRARIGEAKFHSNLAPDDRT